MFSSLLLLAGAGCREANPLYSRVDAGPAEAGPGKDAARDVLIAPDLAPQDRRGVLSDVAPDVLRDAAADREPDLAPDTPLVPDLGKEVARSEVAPKDLPRDKSIADAGSDAVDAPGEVHDSGPADLGGDTAPGCVEGTTQACAAASYTAGAVCRIGIATCTGGTWGPCVDEVASVACGLGVCQTQVASCSAGLVQACTPLAPTAAAEGVDGCGNGDEDCDGITDEDCLDCVRVVPNGGDPQPDGSEAHPFGNIQEAVSWAAASPARPKRVCVSGGADCSVAGSSSYVGALTIPAGISVVGGYAHQPWISCGPGTSPTGLKPSSESGVELVAGEGAVGTPTELARFSITRQNGASLAAVAGVTVNGVRGVVLSQIFINDSPIAQVTYGVNVIDGAEVSIYRSAVWSGNGRNEAVAVRVEAARVTLRENCDGPLDAFGRCKTACSATAVKGQLGLRGPAAASGGFDSRAHVVRLSDAPGSLVESTSVCSSGAEHGAGIHISGAGAGIVIRGNTIEAWEGERETYGILLQSCAGESPWIVSNSLIKARSPADTASADAIRSTGVCHPIIDSNLRIAVEVDSDGGTASAINCLDGSGCRVLDNAVIQGGETSNRGRVVGIRCEGMGTCPLVAGNASVHGGRGQNTAGALLIESDAVLDGNDIAGGCGTVTSSGLDLRSASATVLRNRIWGSRCATLEAPAKEFRGIQVQGTAGSGELRVEANEIDAMGADGSCTSYGIDLATTASAITASGVYAANKIRAGICSTRVDFREASQLRPRILELNNFAPGTAYGTVLYQRGDKSLYNADDINALTGGTSSSGNFSSIW